ncbi:MAG: hypothetical protein ACJ8FS_08080 [Sphingomicrobium sp.]
MGFERNIGRAGLVLALLLGAVPVAAAPPEPLIVTQLPDPDPGYVARPEPKLQVTQSRGDPDENSIDTAMQTFGRAIGQAALLEEQAIEVRCRSAEPSGGSAVARFAWEANCRYQRH